MAGRKAAVFLTTPLPLKTMTDFRNVLFSAALLLLCLVLWGAPAKAQEALSREPGYVDVAVIDTWFDAPPSVEVNIQGALMRMVASASQNSNPELAGMLGKLKAIQVRGFSTEGAQRSAIVQRTSRLADRLQGQGWETVLRVREEDEDVSVQLKMRGETIAGLVVMATEAEGESFFINIVGDISPEQIGRLGQALDIDPLKDLPDSNASDGEAPRAEP